VAGLPKELQMPGGHAMTVPPLPRDWASSPLLGKAEGSAPNAGEVKRIAANTKTRACVKVFMLLLIYGETSGVKRALISEP